VPIKTLYFHTLDKLGITTICHWHKTWSSVLLCVFLHCLIHCFCSLFRFTVRWETYASATCWCRHDGQCRIWYSYCCYTRWI